MIAAGPAFLLLSLAALTGQGDTGDRAAIDRLYTEALSTGRIPDFEADMAARKEREPANPWVRFYLALVLRERLRWKEAEREFAAATRLRPADEVLWRYRAWHVDTSFRPEEAAALYREGHRHTGARDLLEAAEALESTLKGSRRATRQQLIAGALVLGAFAVVFVLAERWLRVRAPSARSRPTAV